MGSEHTCAVLLVSNKTLDFFFPLSFFHCVKLRTWTVWDTDTAPVRATTTRLEIHPSSLSVLGELSGETH